VTSIGDREAPLAFARRGCADFRERDYFGQGALDTRFERFRGRGILRSNIRVARYADAAIGDHSSCFAGFAAARGIDQGLSAPLDLRMRNSAEPSRLSISRAAGIYFLFAIVEAVPQDETQHLARCSTCLPGELLQPTLLCGR